ncbi:DNA polymerase III subunit chi [Candidatus Pantoea carbekii]|nr:DNA polymerase III subunit chi [Candidatus Pantoea carbekii]AKC31972.1 DNA polymerase III chi subunit HolC [Candidatus Pantoea carbekii]
MKKATFYILNSNNIQNGLTAIETLVCNLVNLFWRNKKRILISCENKKQAYCLDEALWLYPANTFIPHNLVGEKINYSAPIEIIWPQHSHNYSKQDILINLLPQFTNLVTVFDEVIDFVPYEKKILKELARQRYKTYRGLGFQLSAVYQ